MQDEQRFGFHDAIDLFTSHAMQWASKTSRIFMELEEETRKQGRAGQGRAGRAGQGAILLEATTHSDP